MSRERLEAAAKRSEFARAYTNMFLEDVPPEQWFWRPAEAVTHIAWQVGHVAAAEYGLCLMRVRGRTEADRDLIGDDYFDRFKRGSMPAEGAENNLSVEEIRRVFDAVHRQAMAEIAEATDEQLDEPVEQPHPAFRTKLEAIEFAAQHEMIHAGQIALLRRLMGRGPLR